MRQFGWVPMASIKTVEPLCICPTDWLQRALIGVWSCLMFPTEETINNVWGLMFSMLLGGDMFNWFCVYYLDFLESMSISFI